MPHPKLKPFLWCRSCRAMRPRDDFDDAPRRSNGRKTGKNSRCRSCRETFNTTLRARFFSHVEKSSDPDGCWRWTGSGSYGYGYVHVHVSGEGVKRRRSHRVSWELHYGEIPAGLWVLHRCDNPACVNPDHLFLGTHTDNMRDREAKGRGNHPRGEANHFACLTVEIVAEIRERYAAGGITQKQLSDAYGVTPSNISAIIRRQSWR